MKQEHSVSLRGLKKTKNTKIQKYNDCYIALRLLYYLQSKDVDVVRGRNSTTCEGPTVHSIIICLLIHHLFIYSSFIHLSTYVLINLISYFLFTNF